MAWWQQLFKRKHTEKRVWIPKSWLYSMVFLPIFYHAYKYTLLIHLTCFFTLIYRFILYLSFLLIIWIRLLFFATFKFLHFHRKSLFFWWVKKERLNVTIFTDERAVTLPSRFSSRQILWFLCAKKTPKMFWEHLSKETWKPILRLFIFMIYLKLDDTFIFNIINTCVV